MTRYIELKTRNQSELWFSYKNEIKKHNSYKIRNEYFKEHKNMEAWEDELKKITFDMREKMKILQIQENKEKKERLQMEKQEESKIKEKQHIRTKKSNDTRKKNKEIEPVRKSIRIKEKNKNEVEIINVISFEEKIKLKLEEAKQNGNYIDLTA